MLRLSLVFNQIQTTTHLRHPSALPFSPQQFQALFTLSSKSFSSFPHGTFALSVSRRYLAFDGIYHLLGVAIPNNSTLRTPPVRCKGSPSHRRGSHPLRHPFPKDLHSGHSWDGFSRLQLDPRTENRFPYWAFPSSLAVTGGILVSFFSSAYWYA